MMGSHGRAAEKQAAARRSIGQSFASCLLPGSSDGIEGSSSSSSHSGASFSDTAYLHHRKTPRGQNHRHHHQAPHYANSENSIFAITNAGTTNTSTQRQQLSYLQETDEALDDDVDDGSPNSSSTANLEPPFEDQKRRQLGKSEDRQVRGIIANQQHRRLQYQVHQQLQRIYDNAAPVVGRSQTRTTMNQSHKHESSDGQARHQFLFKCHKQHLQQQLNPQTHQQRKSIMGDSLAKQPHPQDNSNELDNRDQQFAPSILNDRNHMMMKGQPHEQTYDSLSPVGMSKHHRHNHQQIIGSDEGYHAQATGGLGASQYGSAAPICAIPEECSGDENVDLEEDELLVPEAVVRSTPPRQRLALDRKSHLEELHYATATAAALLSATASAAAAFAANEKPYDRSSNALTSSYGHHGELPINNRANAPDSGPYQELVKNQQGRQNDRLLSSVRYQQRVGPSANMLHRQCGPIYADATNQNNYVRANFNPRHSEHFRMSNPTSASAINGPSAMRVNGLPGQMAIQHKQHQQQQMYNIHHNQQFNIQPNRPMPPQPPIRQHTNQHHMNMIAGAPTGPMIKPRQQRLIPLRGPQIQRILPTLTMPAPPPAPAALAILHHGGKNGAAPIKADLIGRIWVNNLIAARQHQYAMASRGPLPVPSNQHHQNIVIREPMYYERGVHGKEKLYCAAPGPVIAALPARISAGSDSSGHSNVPLVLDRKLKPLGVIERICRIDLAVFWWSLLIVSFLFIGALITISRYIF